MRFIYSSFLFFFLSTICAAQVSTTLPAIPFEMLTDIQQRATRVELVTLTEGNGTVTLEDSSTVKAVVGFMQSTSLEGDKSCPVLAKMFVYSNEELILDADMHYFGPSNCGFFVIRKNNEQVYYAFMDLGGKALCSQLVGYNGYPTPSGPK